jgi:hypothetical protein
MKILCEIVVKTIVDDYIVYYIWFYGFFNVK